MAGVVVLVRWKKKFDSGQSGPGLFVRTNHYGSIVETMAIGMFRKDSLE
jgi:hypothetical protein